MRKSGNDSNNGLSAGAAWLTFDKVFDSGSGVTGGDIVYVGAGIYRETLASGAVNLTNPTSEVRIVGDVDGAYTGDPGPVIWTTWTTSDIVAPSGSPCMNVNSKDYLSFERICFIAGGSSGTHTTIGNHCRFIECKFQCVGSGITCLTATTVQATSKDLIVDRCVALHLSGAAVPNFLVLTHTQNATAEYDCGVIVKNSLFYNWGAVVANANTGSSTFKGGGGKVLNCTCVNCSNVLVGTTANCSGQYPMQVLNCALVGSSALNESTVAGAAVAENNYSTSTTSIALDDGLFAKSQSSRAHYLDWGELGLWGLGGVGLCGPYPYAYTGLPLLPNAPQGLAVGRGGTATEDATVGTVTWTTPGNADFLNDGNNAVSGAIAQNAVTRYIKLVNNVAVPSGATIKGVRMQVIALASAGSSVRMSSVKLVKAGTISGNDLAAGNTTLLGATNTVQSYGSASDPLWGLALADTDVNDATFGCVVAFTNTNASSRTCTVSGVRLVVSYELAGEYYDLAVDLLNRPRPAGMRQTAPQVGALESHDSGVKEGSVAHSGVAALKFIGPGDQELAFPVDAVPTTITVYARYDSTHAATNKPQMVLLASPDIGVATATATMTVAADTWEAIALTFTPTAKGIVIVRLRSRSAGAAGLAYFDDFAATI